MTEDDKTQSYTAGVIVIGNEILSGRTPDANVSWIAELLTKQGVILVEVRIVRDQKDEIVSAVNSMREKYSYVFTTGGIGPTHDDITAQCIADAFGVELVEDEFAMKILEAYYMADLNEPRRKMAMIPDGAELIPNPVSAAPGFRIENVYVMAGVPRIMQAMFDNVLSSLDGGTPIQSNTITCQLSESILAEPLAEIQSQFDDVDIGSYPHFRGGVLGLSVVLRGVDEARLSEASDKVVEMIRELGDEPRAMSLRSGHARG